MVFSPELLDALQGIEPEAWRGTVYRHMLANYPPERENTRGARWNPPEVAAIYTSLQRPTALAEADYQIASQPRPLRTKRTMYTIELSLDNVLDLTAAERLEALGIDPEALRGDVPTACQRVGGAAAWLGHDGILVPSARHSGSNLVVYPGNRSPDAVFTITEAEDIPVK